VENAPSWLVSGKCSGLPSTVLNNFIPFYSGVNEMCDCEKKVTVIEECKTKEPTQGAELECGAIGVVVGAMIGGPIGAVVGGVLGASYGSPNRKEKKNK
jgi:putative N-acetylmannosamine-6-phosphate epimerase